MKANNCLYFPCPLSLPHPAEFGQLLRQCVKNIALCTAQADGGPYSPCPRTQDTVAPSYQTKSIHTHINLHSPLIPHPPFLTLHPIFKFHCSLHMLSFNSDSEFYQACFFCYNPAFIYPTKVFQQAAVLPIRRTNSGKWFGFGKIDLMLISNV